MSYTKPQIDILKTETNNSPSISNVQNDKIQEMQSQITKFVDMLKTPNENFDVRSAFNMLYDYISKYERILYSPISNEIYAYYDKYGYNKSSATLLSNIDSLVAYSNNKKANINEDEYLDKTVKSVQKMWDHITLAGHQYLMLKQSDDEYKERFQKHIDKYKQDFQDSICQFKDEMSKETNTQMITMVGIFTALAFLIFGSISSLDGIFENIKFPLFKVMSIGLIWGLCTSNMIFIFLYFISKMTKLNFQSNQSKNANIFQRYPIFWWTNFLLITLLTLSSWGYFCQQYIITYLIGACNPMCIFWIGNITILIFVILFFILLLFKTKTKK